MDAAAPDARRAGLVEAMFRELTDVNAEGSAIRRPRALRDLATVAGATPDELRPLIDAFRAPGASFLTPYAPAPLNEKSVIDISHEALIRCWRRIASPKNGWLKREFDDGLAWRSLRARQRASIDPPSPPPTGRHALAFVVESTKIAHGAGIAGGGGLFEPFARLGVVLRHAVAIPIEVSEI